MLNRKIVVILNMTLTACSGEPATPLFEQSNAPQVEGYATSRSALSGGTNLQNSEIENAAAIYLELSEGQGFRGCSGMLVTPYWFLTAAHCFNDDATPLSAYGSNINDPIRVNAIERFELLSVPQDCADEDAALVRMAAPMYPRRADGTVWELYRRDLYRGDLQDLTETVLDLYGFGPTSCGGSDIGRARYGQLTLDTIETDGSLELTGFDSVELWERDSGSAILTPGQGEISAFEGYEIAGVTSCASGAVGCSQGGSHVSATAAAALTTWFDDVLEDEWNQFDAPSQIVASIAFICP